MTTGWTPEEEKAFAAIQKTGDLTRMEAVRLLRRCDGDLVKAIRIASFKPGRASDCFPADALRSFAKRFRLAPSALRFDSCNEPILIGRKTAKDMPSRVEYHSHIFDFGDGQRFGLCFMHTSVRTWTYRRKSLESAGFTISQDGDSEGIALFDPHNDAQAKLAIKFAGVKRAVNLSPEVRAKRADTIKHARTFRKR